MASKKSTSSVKKSTTRVGITKKPKPQNRTIRLSPKSNRWEESQREWQPVKPKKKKVQHEQFDQSAGVNWFRRQYPRLAVHLSASANGGKRTAREGARMKKLGVLKGELDLFLSLLNIHEVNGLKHVYGGLYVEWKHGKGKISPEQQIIIMSRRLAGYRVEIVIGLDGFKAVIQDYLKDAIMPYPVEPSSLPDQQCKQRLSDLPVHQEMEVELSRDFPPEILEALPPALAANESETVDLEEVVSLQESQHQSPEIEPKKRLPRKKQSCSSALDD
jgi:hypothetical protein